MFSKKFIKYGFTLIELLVVISIIGILATFVSISTQGARLKARDVRRLTDLRQIQLALAFFYDDGQVYMGTAGQDSWGNSATANTLVYELEKSAYIKPVPDDPGKNKYEYWVSTDKQKYILKAVLEGPNHPALKNDLDGSILGVNCGTAPNDPEGYFCAGS